MKNVAKKSLSFSLAALFAASITACGTSTTLNNGLAFNNADQVNSFARRNAGGKKWTIAIHMAADNNLYTAGLDDINEMEAGLTSPDINVVVLFDGAKQGDSKVYEIKNDKNGYDKNIISKEVDDKGVLIPASKEIDSGDPKVFAKFSDWVTKNYPAERTFIAIWNHGDGIFRNSGTPTMDGRSFVPKPVKEIKPSVMEFSSKAFASDDNGGEMHLYDLNPALDLAKKNMGKNLDIMGFDTCLMGHLEAAYQVKGQADYLVASEELEPGDGWDYHGFLKALSANPGMNGAQAASALVDTYGKSYAPGGSQYGRDVTLSATDVSRVANNLTPALNDFADELKGNLGSIKSTLTTVRTSTQTFYNRDSADLGDFLGRLKKEAGVESTLKDKIAKVSDEYAKAVIRETHTGKITMNGVGNASGLVVYFPNSNMGYNKKYDDVSKVKFAEQPNWGNFLKAFTAKNRR